MPRALIAGASIAGPALAYWLRRYGWQVTVVERAPALRTGGQNIDVRGAGREVARRMGVESDIRAATTGERGTRFVREDGRAIAEFPASASGSDGPTAELEILRGDLARILVDRAVAVGAEFRWGDSITGVDEGDATATVAFEHAEDAPADLVVAADGIGSSTRRLVFGDEARIRSLGLETTWLTIPRTGADDDWWRWFNAPGGLTVTLRPDPVGTIRATLGVRTDPADSDSADSRTLGSRSIDEQKRMLRQRFVDVGWEAPRVLAALDDADDVYFQQVAQVSAPRWSAGRVALLGDAAYCASPVSGMGTSLALVGAYVLAGELAAHVDRRDAFRGYERLMRPYVDQAQKLPPGVPGIANPRSRAGIGLFGAGVRLASSRVFARLGERFASPPADRIDLPDYAHLEV